jgi:hypothetical protein
MIKILPLLFTLFLSSTFVISCAQEKEKKEIKKEIRVEQENGQTTVTVTETENGKVTEKIFTGEEAEQYLDKHNDSKGNSFYFSGDDEDGQHVVIVKEIDGDGDSDHNVWFSDGDDMHVEMVMAENELAGELEKLLDEMDNLKKEEIKLRLEEMMKESNEIEKEMVIKMESIHEHNGDVKVNVEENDGVITIEKTINGKTTVEIIDIDEKHKSGKNVYIIKTSGDDDEEVVFTEGSAAGHSDNMNLNVYPNPNEGSFTIEMDLQSNKKAKVNVVDSEGNEVYNKVVQGEGKHKLDVKLKSSKKGMFIVTVEQGNEIMKLKTMIK